MLVKGSEGMEVDKNHEGVREEYAQVQGDGVEEGNFGAQFSDDLFQPLAEKTKLPRTQKRKNRHAYRLKRELTIRLTEGHKCWRKGWRYQLRSTATTGDGGRPGRDH